MHLEPYWMLPICFLKGLHQVTHYQQSMRAPMVPLPCQHLTLWDLLNFCNLMGVKWFLMVFRQPEWLNTFLHIHQSVFLFWELAVHVFCSFEKKHLKKYWCPHYIFWRVILHQIPVLHLYSSTFYLVFTLLKMVFAAQNFYLDVVTCINLYFYGLCCFCLFKINLPLPLGHKDMGIPHFIALPRSWMFYKWKVPSHPALSKSTDCRFPSSICSPYVSASHFGNPHRISQFLIIIILVMAICDKWWDPAESSDNG